MTDVHPESGVIGETAMAPRARRWHAVCVFALLMVAVQLVLGPKIRLSQWGVSAESNAGVAEGEAWLKGRLDLPATGGDPRQERLHDTACFEGRVYNVYPPLMAFLTVLLSPVHRLLLERTDLWLPWSHALLVYWPLPVVGFLVIRRQVNDPVWAALLTLGWMGGTALLPNLAFARTGYLGQTMHVFSQTGILLVAGDVLGRRRIWPGLLGLAISVWSRQLTIFYALPLLWAAWKGPVGRTPAAASESALRTANQSPGSTLPRISAVVVGAAVIAAPMLVLNQLKFGDPFDSGYSHIYVGQEDIGMGLRFAEHGLFSTHFIPENLYYMHAALPAIGFALTEVRVHESSAMGTSIWVTSPILLWVFLSAPRWLRDPGRRVLMLSTVPILAGLACYHSPGFMQHGYNRFALDVIPAWLVVIAPYSRGAARAGRWTWREWFTVGCVAWGLLYFHLVVPDA